MTEPSQDSSTAPSSAPVTTADRVRQVVVLIGAVLAMAAAVVGSGAFGGTDMEETAGGALDTDATWLAPASAAFRIWSVIYIGLLAFAIYHAIPRIAAHPRLREIGWWVLLSMVLNAVWIWVVQVDQLRLSVVVIFALVAVLSVVAVILVRRHPRTVVEALVTDVTMGLYLGWVSVATVANVTADLTFAEVDLGWTPQGWAAAMIAVAMLLGVALAWYARTNPWLAGALTAAIAWALAWIAVGRTAGVHAEDWLVWVAAGAAVVVAVAGVATVLGQLARPGSRSPDRSRRPSS